MTMRRRFSALFLGLLAALSLLAVLTPARSAHADEDPPAEPTPTPTPAPTPAPTPTPDPAPAPAPTPTPASAPAPAPSAPRAGSPSPSAPTDAASASASASAPAPSPGQAPPHTPLAPDTTPLTPFPGAEEPPSLRITPLGYVEAYYAYNFNRPANNITNFRGFDNRHNSFTLSNAVLGAAWETGPVSGRLLLQVGSTPSTYYGSEPTIPRGSAANGSSGELWKYLQEANISYKAPIGRGLKVTAGLMASPFGHENFAVKDNWMWSRSNLFFALPYYHAGVRASYELTDRFSASLSALNGWNSVVDNNDGKSIMAQLNYIVPDRVRAQVLYFGGIERPSTALEGQPWRHSFDAFGEVQVTARLAVAAHASYGFEDNRLGTARWGGGALYARATATRWLFFAVRGDRFYERTAGTALFWDGVPWVSSLTANADVRPHDNISIRLEFRHDQADGLLYYTGATLVGDGSANSPFVTNARRQQTLLLGATAWF